ncbi:Arginine n-methyltransferase, partial [Globisporangium splendens]
MYAGVDKYGGAVVGEGQPDGTAPATGSAATGLSLEEAVETAAAEETVVVDVPYSYYEDDTDESSLVTGTSQVLLTAQLNPEAGGLMWVEQESSQDAYKNVVAMSQMTSMLRDLDRNRCYELGIKGAIERFIARHKRAPIVLDIGTGTGLLSMFAATHGAEHVYACEMFKPMADIAENVTKANHPDKITVFALRSTDLIVASEENGGVGHLPRRADMLVSELFDSILLGEAVIPVVRHAIEHLLVPDAAILPERAMVFAHVVQNEQIYRLNSVSGQYLNDQQARLARNDAAWECTGGKPALPLHYRALEPQSTPLTNVTPVLSFDFTKPIASATTYQETVVNAVASGDVHAVVMWWEVSFGDDTESSIVYSTKPGVQNWQDHWVPVVFPLTERVHVNASDAVVLRAHHDDLHIWFDVELQEQPQAQLSSPSKKKMKQQVQREKMPCTCGLHLVSNAERIAMLSDSTRTSTFNAAIAYAIATLKQRKADQQQDNEDLACLDISDGSLCALLAASHGVANVTSVESKDVSARIFQQIFDNQPAASENQVEVLCCGCKGLLPDHLQGGKPVDLLLGEPFYYSMQNLPLWQAFNFWLRRSAVTPALVPHALVLPARARVCALAVRFEHLHECFGAVGNVSGYDHSYFDQFQESYYTRNFPFPVYMYPYEAVSEVLTLATCEYQSIAESVFTELTTELPQEPNGVIVWVQYALDTEEKHVVATGPAAIHSKQLVRFLPPSAATTAEESATKVSLQSRFHFNALEGTINVDFAIV